MATVVYIVNSGYPLHHAIGCISFTRHIRLHLARGIIYVVLGIGQLFCKSSRAASWMTRGLVILASAMNVIGFTGGWL